MVRVLTVTRSRSRRSVLRPAALGSLALLAGCVTSRDVARSSPTDATETERPSPTDTTATEPPTAESVDCDAVSSPPNPAGTADVDPKPYPDFPSELSRSAVTAFVTDYEAAYAHNDILSSEQNLAYVDVSSVEIAGAERDGERFVVRVVVEFGWGERGDGETATSLHADGGSKVSYLVGERVLERVEADEWEFPDPRTTPGTVLRCGAETTAE